MFTLLNLTRHKLVISCTLSLLIGACSIQPGKPSAGSASTNSAEQAAELLQQGDLLGAVGIYDRLAGAASTPAADDWRMQAIDTLLIQYPDLAAARLQQLKPNTLQPEQQRRWLLLNARLALANQQADAALKQLPIITSSMDDAERAAILETQAMAYEQLGRTEAALRSRIQLEPLLSEIAAIDRNHNRIWQLLSQPSLLEIATLRQQADGDVYRGWLDLAESVRGTRLQQGNLNNAIRNWLYQYPAHPAADSFAGNLLDNFMAQRDYPAQIALLLPLSGRYLQAGTAIRDGFLSAYYQTTGDETKPEIRIYDVGEDLVSFNTAYQQASEAGAQFIVGPLDKAAVTQIAVSTELLTPTLSLNYADTLQAEYPSNFWQFGLLPEDEAAQSAELALASGLRRGVALVSKDNLGERMLSAFRQRYSELGGQLSDYAFYLPEKNDFSAPIEQLMGLAESENRQRALDRVIVAKTEFEPRRRDDIDMIFVAASPKNARLIRPQMKFFRSGDIPMYATSSVYSGNPDPRADKDLDGLIYLDAPLILGEGSEQQALRAELQQLWPNSAGRLSRLYALGFDAFKLIPDLSRLSGDANAYHAGMTGDLSMDPQHRIHRRLRWASFSGGIPKNLSNAQEETTVTPLNLP